MTQTGAYAVPQWTWKSAVLAILWLLLWLLLWLAWILPPAVFAAPFGDGPAVEIIVNADQASVPLDRELLRGIFSMRVRTWPSGEPVKVFVLPDDSDLSDRFYREQLGTYSYVLRSAWDRMVFTGTGFAPIEIKSEAEMRDRVRRTPGAIGYVSSGKNNQRSPPSVGISSIRPEAQHG